MFEMKDIFKDGIDITFYELPPGVDPDKIIEKLLSIDDLILQKRGDPDCTDPWNPFNSEEILDPKGRHILDLYNFPDRKPQYRVELGRDCRYFLGALLPD